jgi:HEAT repeat protein
MCDELETAVDDRLNQRARIAAIRRLVAAGGSDAARVLSSALALPDADFQLEMANNMVETGGPALAALAVVAGDKDSRVRCNAITILARFEDPGAVDLLIRDLTDPDRMVRMAAAEALGRLNDKRVIDGMAAIARNDPDPDCRQVAESVLHRIGRRRLAPHLKKLTSGEPDHRSEARRAIVAEGSVVIATLTELLDHGNPVIRHAVVDILGDIGDARGLTPLIRAMTDPDDDVRLAINQALGRMRSETVARALIANLTSPDDRLGADSIQALQSQGTSAVLPLIELLGSSRRELRTIAVDLLSKIRDRRATQPLMHCLTSPDTWMRTAAARSLGRLGDSDATDAIIHCLQDPVPLVRAATAEALGELRSSRATEPLVAALHDQELIVQNAAARALGRIGDDRAAEPLIRSLSRDDVSLKVAIIEALADSRNSRAIPVLKRILSPWPLSNEPSEVKAAARRALELLQPRF